MPASAGLAGLAPPPAARPQEAGCALEGVLHVRVLITMIMIAVLVVITLVSALLLIVAIVVDDKANPTLR